MQINYPVKVQIIRSKGQKSRLYVSIPLALAAAIDMEGGEEVEWKLVNNRELYLIRSLPAPKQRIGKIKK